MGLLQNGFRHNAIGKLFGGTNLDGANPSVHEYQGHLTGRMRNRFSGEGALAKTASVPDGCRHPAAWVMPVRAGGLSSRNSIAGIGIASGGGQSGYNIAAALTGAGDIPPLDMGLIIAIAATIVGSGDVSSAEMTALADMVAAITGSGSVTATAAGLASLGAALAGSSSISAGNTALMDIASNIRGYGDLTPEGLRDAVWNAAASGYLASNTMGQKLNSAASGGVDYGSMADAVRTELQAELLRIVELAQLHGLVVGTDLVVTPTSRTAGSVVQVITGDGTTTSTVSRT